MQPLRQHIAPPGKKVFNRANKAVKNKKQEKTQATSLYLPDYPYEYEHFITEPLKGGEQMLYFREFYQIPENTELLFDPIDD